ncbi:MAG: hypothetical protein K0M40_03560 [Prolixibacteraceae bacterium]|nr:hypothetical protein [Prolixibacteraceae bacterium]
MTNTLIHIALYINKKDVDSFYLDVLHGEITRTFELSKDVSSDIFNIDKNVKVVQVSCNGIDFELFIDDDPQLPTFAHVCFYSEQAQKIKERANQKGYRTHSHKNNSAETYFIRDGNYNLFEIKQERNTP